MRLLPVLAALTLGSLVIAAFLLGSEAVTNRMLNRGIDSAFHDASYEIAHRVWTLRAAVLSAVAGGLLALTLRLGTTRAKTVASVATILWALGLVAALSPQFSFSRSGLPRRHVEHPAVFQAWDIVTNLGTVITLGASAILLGCAVLALAARLRARPD